jgi:hypothetical protein
MQTLQYVHNFVKPLSLGCQACPQSKFGSSWISFPQLFCYLGLAARNTAVMIVVARAIFGFKSRGIVLLPVINARNASTDGVCVLPIICMRVR